MAKHKNGGHAEQPVPVLGSLLWYHPADGDPGPHPGDRPLAAIVASVLTDNSVNLTIFAADGQPYARQSVLFVRKGDSSMGNEYCETPGHEAEPWEHHEEGSDLEKQRTTAYAKEAAVAAQRDDHPAKASNVPDEKLRTDPFGTIA